MNSKTDIYCFESPFLVMQRAIIPSVSGTKPNDSWNFFEKDSSWTDVGIGDVCADATCLALRGYFRPE